MRIYSGGLCFAQGSQPLPEQPACAAVGAEAEAPHHSLTSNREIVLEGRIIAGTRTDGTQIMQRRGAGA